MQLTRLMTMLIIALLIGGASAASANAFNNQDNKGAMAKPADPVSGKYEGVAKSAQMGDIPITADLKNEAGKLSGKLETPQGPATLTSGTYADGKVMMKLDVGGNELTIKGEVKDDKIVGDWELGGQTGTFELKKMAAAAATPASPATPSAGATPAKPAAGDPISGVWDANAEAQGASIPFTLKLKLDGEKVTGDSESAQGSLPISKGSWVGEKLTITLSTPNGDIILNGTIKDGKITGQFDFAGQFQGPWEAKKK